MKQRDPSLRVEPLLNNSSESDRTEKIALTLRQMFFDGRLSTSMFDIYRPEGRIEASRHFAAILASVPVQGEAVASEQELLKALKKARGSLNYIAVQARAAHDGFNFVALANAEMAIEYIDAALAAPPVQTPAQVSGDKS